MNHTVHTNHSESPASVIKSVIVIFEWMFDSENKHSTVLYIKR